MKFTNLGHATFLQEGLFCNENTEKTLKILKDKNIEYSQLGCCYVLNSKHFHYLKIHNNILYGKLGAIVYSIDIGHIEKKITPYIIVENPTDIMIGVKT